MIGLMTSTSNSEMLPGWIAQAISQMLTLVRITISVLPSAVRISVCGWSR